MLDHNIPCATFDEQQHERSPERLAASLDDLPFPAILALDPACSRIAANHAARDAFHLAGADLRADELPVARFRHFNDRITTKAPALPLATAISENRTIGPIDVTLGLSGSKTIATRVITAPLRGEDGAPTGAIALFLDVDRPERGTTDLRILAETIPHFVWICNPDGRLIYCNQSLLLYAGLTLAELLKAASFTRILFADDAARVHRSWTDAMRKRNDAFEAECRIVGSDGRPRWFLLRARPLRSGSRAAAFWFGTATQIEEQKQAEQSASRSEASFRTLTETVPQFIFRVGTDGTRTFVNHGFADYSGASNDDAAFIEHLHPKDRERVTALRDKWQETGQPIDVDFRLRGQDGTYRWFLSRRRPVVDRDGSILEWVGSITDINSGKIAELSSHLLAELTGHFSNDRSLEEALHRVAATCATAFDAVCIIDLLAEWKPVRIACAHPDVVEDQADWAVLTEAPHYDDAHPIRMAMRTRSVQRVQQQEAEALLGGRPVGSGIAVPLSISDRTVLGALTLLNSVGGMTVDNANMRLAMHVARRLSERIESMQVLERERKVALEFQRAALPLELPELSGIRVGVNYTAGKDEATVGGDWYDLFTIPDGRVVITIGDVAGSGLRAAVVMAQLRHTIRALTYSDADPRSVAVHSDAILRSEYADVFATAFIAVYSPQTRELQYVRCGHPTPLLRTASGSVSELEGEPNLPIGLLSLAPGPSSSAVSIPEGALLVCYTDGLIEGERKPLDALRCLRCVLSDEKIAADPAAISRTILHGNAPRDDTVVMTLRFS